MDSTLATNIAMTSISKYRAKQVASELSPAIQIVHELCPSVVLEIGSAEGGTIYAWSQCIPEHAMIISIDPAINPDTGAFWTSFMIEGQKLFTIQGRSEHSFDAILNIIGDRRIDFLFIDGSHFYDTVRNDFDMYSGLVAETGIIAIHDVGHRRPDMQVWKLWDDVKVNRRHTELIDPIAPCGIGILYGRECIVGLGDNIDSISNTG